MRRGEKRASEEIVGNGTLLDEDFVFFLLACDFLSENHGLNLVKPCFMYFLTFFQKIKLIYFMETLGDLLTVNLIMDS